MLINCFLENLGCSTPNLEHVSVLTPDVARLFLVCWKTEESAHHRQLVVCRVQVGGVVVSNPVFADETLSEMVMVTDLCVEFAKDNQFSVSWNGSFVSVQRVVENISNFVILNVELKHRL